MDTKTVLTEQQIHDIIDDLRGTSGDYGAVIQAFSGTDASEIDETSLSKIDESIFFCEMCERWHDRDEESEYGSICWDCLPDHTDD